MAHAQKLPEPKQTSSKQSKAQAPQMDVEDASIDVKREKGRPSNQSLGLPEPEYMKRMAARAEKRGISLDEYMVERKENRKKAALAKKGEGVIARKASASPVMESADQEEETRTVVAANGKAQRVLVKSTADYTKFSIHPANRHIMEGRVRKLVEDITKNNMLHLNPIIVDMEWRIVNGQHRFRAAKELGLPVYYIQGDVTAKEMLELNANQKALALKDYLDSYVAQGYPEYIKVKDFIDKYKTVLYNAIGLLSGRRSQPNSELVNTFKDGMFIVRDLEHAEHIMKIRDRMSEHAADFYTQKNFTNAVAKVADMEKFDEQHFLKQVDKKGYGQLHPAINTDLYAQQIVDLYNHGIPKKRQLHLDAK